MTDIAQPLLAWYHQNRRVLPFRERPTAYGVWVSEIMLQQTRVSAALPYYERFMAELPTVAALAACGEQKLHTLWEGLGYYSRARNLQKAARMVVEQYGGELPADYDALLALPGVGPYTAGAVASIAFGLPCVAVDGNVLRVASRLLAETGDVGAPAVKQALSAAVQAAQPPDAPGDFNQALMELGALVCLPGTPRCGECPLAALCEGRRLGLAETLPTKAPKAPKRELPVCVLVVHCGEQVLLCRRPAAGLLAGLWGPLTFEGAHTKAQAQAMLHALLPGAELGAALPEASHVFTHRVWRMYGWQAQAKAALPVENCIWVQQNEWQGNYALPAAFRAYKPALAGQSPPPKTAR